MDRGQAHTLEAFMAALLLVSGVLFALDATAVTPLSASTSNQHIQNQQRHVANDLLAVAAENGSLRAAVTDWNTTQNEFRSAENDGYFVTGGPPNAFGRALNETFVDDRVAVNVHVVYWDGDGREEQPLVYMGTPSDNAVAASRLVGLYNDTALSSPGTSVNVSTARANGNFYVPDAVPGSRLHNLVEVRLVAWRM